MKTYQKPKDQEHVTECGSPGPKRIKKLACLPYPLLIPSLVRWAIVYAGGVSCWFE